MRVLAASAAILAPGAALACALAPSIILTLPTDYYLAGAGLTVAVTGLLAASLHRLPALRAVTLWDRPVLIPETVTSYLGFLFLALLVIIGHFGSSDPMHNLLALWVWTGLWVALPLAMMLFGNLWRMMNPWTGPVRIARALFGRKGGIGLTRLGHWPAVAGLFAFFWFYIVSLSPEDPQHLARLVLIYWLVIFALAVAEGEDWLQQGEFLTVYLTLIARIAPFWLEITGNRARLRAGFPGAQVLEMPPLSPSAIAFVTLALAGLSFDGLAGTFRWLALIGENPLEFTGRSAVMGVNTAGLILSWALTAGLILGALKLGAVLARGPVMAVAGGGGGLRGGGQAPDMGAMLPVMLSFLAIAAGYHAAHHLVILLTTGQYTLAALNDPLFRGDAFLGLSVYFVSMGFLADRSAMIALWNAQFALILGAHVLAVILSFRLAGPHLPARAHLPLTLLMVGYTVFGLWLLSAARGF
ncbi:hypothetical protein [Szabonella alba]|uniref:Uncharacterized protein n=1 Tax=Szabonella alba TaxID=2804194 RepID=A0A8K0Y070_9RHOB|nr:hypothetical protein [Szabonella alba]MBL4916517.1 hypothetical protein [Szabonella alba]